MSGTQFPGWSKRPCGESAAQTRVSSFVHVCYVAAPLAGVNLDNLVGVVFWTRMYVLCVSSGILVQGNNEIFQALVRKTTTAAAVHTNPGFWQAL